MKALLVNPEFPLSFWSMKETCHFRGKKALLPPLGLMTVAALLPPQWQVRLKDLNTSPLASTDWDWADLILITGMIIQQQGVLSLIREAKARGKTTVVGGPFATSLPEQVLEAGVDFLVRGEGEATIPRLLAALQAGEPGGVISEGRKPEMTRSPVPRFGLVNLRDYDTMSIQTSRGCPFDCEFCDIVSLFGRKPRYKEPHQVIAELEVLYDLGWRNNVFISDDNFIGNQEHARAILDRLIPWMKSHGEPFCFWTQASVNLGHNREMIDLLTAANFSNVFLGVESPDTEILRAAGKFQNLKSPLEEPLTAINANGLGMVASFVIGFDGEQAGAGERICRFVERLGIPIVMLNLLHPLPRTRLWDRLEREGRLVQGETHGNTYGLKFNFRPSRPPEEILSEYVRTIDYLYEPSRYFSRCYRYFLTMRPTRRALAAKDELRTIERPKPTSGSPSPNITGREWLFFLKFLWSHGVRASYRGQFWRQLLGIYRQNPSRLTTYLKCCVMVENLLDFKKHVLEKLGGESMNMD